ncbi:DNA polymerase III subunit [Marinomonas algicola]|uniref:DNA polymerase III subunit n=1 Tax=Marinomonas algicola TaxID=2773454 RepID=UPI0017496104|nr:DNA polymerase III subunit [Marinomonas algicola]
MLLPSWLQKEYHQLVALKQAQALSHAILIIGPQGAGQEKLSEQLSIDLMCERSSSACGVCHSCELMKANTHPDFYCVDGRNDSIKVDQIRTLSKQVSQKSQVGSTKVLHMMHVQNMNVNASNALLKILEEPPSGTFFLLTAFQAASLLPTIRSRCLLVNLPTPTLQEVSQWLAERYPDKNLTSLFWLSQQAYELAELTDSGKDAFYFDFPASLQACIDSPSALVSLLKGVDTKNVLSYIKATQALCHQSVLFSVSCDRREEHAALYEKMITRFGVHKLLSTYESLQLLKDSLGRTNLNAPMQFKHQINKWFS